MNFGDAIMRMRGIKDPRDAIMAQASPAPVAGTPDPAASTQGAPAGAPATAAPPQPAAYTTPPDLAAMYKDLMTYQRKSDMLDQGVKFIASAFSTPEGKRAITSTIGGGGGASPDDMLKSVMALREQQTAAASKQEMMAKLPAIAKQYGIDLDTAYYLYSTGKLDQVITDKEKPDYTSIETSDGSDVVINMQDPNNKTVVGGPDAGKNIEVITRADGSKARLDKATGKIISEVSPAEIKTTTDLTELDKVNSERVAAGQPPIPAEAWLQQQATIKAPKTSVNVGGNKLSEEFAKTYAADYDIAKGARGQVETMKPAYSALKQGIISGSPTSDIELSTRKFFKNTFDLEDDAVINTEKFSSAMKEIVLPKVKSLGTGNSISNADREFIEKAVAGSLSTDPQSALGVMARMERLAREQIIQYNKDVAGLVKDAQGKGENAPMVRMVEVPEPSEAILSLVPDEAVKELLTDNDPKAMAEFDEVFGTGMAEYYKQKVANGG